MENDREIDRVLMNVNRATNGVIAAITFSAKMSLAILTFLMRMAKKGLVANGLADSFKNFNEKTGGDFTVYNIPLSEEKANTMIELNKLELKLQNEKNPLVKSQLRKDIKNLESSLPELKQLEKYGVSFCALPKLNGSSHTIQVAIEKKDDQKFKSWFLNHVTTELKGGEKSVESIKVFTEGNYSILNMPFENVEDLGVMMSDFNSMEINYAMLPDLNVGDGYTQIAIPNSDRGQVETWFKLWKEKALSEGREVKDLYAINENSYVSTGEITQDEYVNMADAPYQEVQKQFETQSTPVPWSSGLGKENSPEFIKLMQNDNYEKITINVDTLIKNHTGNNITRGFQEHGYFVSRMPGTYGANEHTLAIPANQVFSTDREQTVVAFLDKTKDYHVIDSNGNLKKWEVSELKKTYDQVNRGFNQVKALQEGKDIAKSLTVNVPLPTIPKV